VDNRTEILMLLGFLAARGMRCNSEPIFLKTLLQLALCIHSGACWYWMESRRRLHSSGSDRLHVQIIRRSTVGSRTFTASGATVWNDLPAHVTAAPSLAVFRQRLKTFLFSRSYPDIVS